MNRQPTPLYLASGSSRRGDLLRERGLAFEQVAPPFDDTGITLDGAGPPRASEALAYLKATSVADELDAGVVVGCDTVVMHAGLVYGKPRDLDDARAMLTALIGGEHEVVTGVAIVEADGPRAAIFHVTVGVRIGSVEPAALEAYLEAGHWAGKAGGYNLAELEGAWPFEIEGDPTTVVGLPVEAVMGRLGAFAEGRAGGTGAERSGA